LAVKCCCSLCVQVKNFAEFWESNRFTQNWHDPNCGCENCLDSHEAHIAYRAAQSRYIIYSELSYLVHEHRRGELFLNWLFNKMADITYKPDRWWALPAGARTCISWLLEWQHETLPRALWAVSGLVWLDEMGERHPSRF
jgi:hypothetical protein